MGKAGQAKNKLKHSMNLNLGIKVKAIEEH